MSTYFHTLLQEFVQLAELVEDPRVVLLEGLQLGVVLIHLLYQFALLLCGRRSSKLKKPGNSLPLRRQWTVRPHHDLESRRVSLDVAAVGGTDADAEVFLLALIRGDLGFAVDFKSSRIVLFKLSCL